MSDKKKPPYVGKGSKTPKQDAMNYTKSRYADTGKVNDGSRKNYYSSDDTSRMTQDLGNIHGGITTRAGRGDAAKRPGDKNGQAYYDKQYNIDTAYAKSWIAKGAKASETMQADAKDAKANALRIRKLMAAKGNNFMYEPDEKDRQLRIRSAKRYR
jgi:hypothetical protein